MRGMERAIRMGEPVLLQGVSEVLDPSMYRSMAWLLYSIIVGLKSILQRQTTLRGGHHVIKIGDTEIEYNDNFRLLLCFFILVQTDRGLFKALHDNSPFQPALPTQRLHPSYSY